MIKIEGHSLTFDDFSYNNNTLYEDENGDPCMVLDNQLVIYFFNDDISYEDLDNQKLLPSSKTITIKN